MGKLFSEMILDHGRSTCTYTFMCFLVGALSEVWNHFQKQFSHKVLYNYCSIFYWRYLVSNLKSKKNGFPFVFSKTYWSDVGGFFQIWELKFGVIVHMTALKSLRGRTGVACDITHLWPYPILSLLTSTLIKKITWKGDKHINTWTLWLLDQSGPRADLVKIPYG